MKTEELSEAGVAVTPEQAAIAIALAIGGVLVLIPICVAVLAQI